MAFTLAEVLITLDIIGVVAAFSGYFNRYLKITLDCGYTNEKGCVVNAPNYEIDGQPNSVNYATCTKPYYYKLLLQNGASLYYRTGNRPEDGGDPNKMYIFIDVNGQKGPNTWGRDIFEYSYSPKDKVFLPSGDPRFGGYQDCLDHKSGNTCTYYVMYVGTIADY